MSRKPNQPIARFKDMFTPLYDDVMEDPFGDGGEPRVTRRQRWMLYAIAGFFFSFIIWSMWAEVERSPRRRAASYRPPLLTRSCLTSLPR